MSILVLLEYAPCVCLFTVDTSLHIIGPLLYDCVLFYVRYSCLVMCAALTPQ